MNSIRLHNLNFMKSVASEGWLLTSCGMDGVARNCHTKIGHTIG